MSTKDTLESMARNTWLAGLGSIDSSKEALGKSIDAAQQKSNNLYNELLSRGEEIQSKINDKKDEIQSKGKKILGLGSEKSQEEKLAQLNIAVDHLTNVVVNLIEKRSVPALATPATKPVAKTAPKAATSTKAAETAKKIAQKADNTTMPTEKSVIKATTKKAT
ncbi:MAG: vacuolar-type H+-ATPase subunit H [Cognaticolwellia sp.]|jgi:vacuolar-type H+-ATPase subunit H